MKFITARTSASRHISTRGDSVATEVILTLCTDWNFPHSSFSLARRDGGRASHRLSQRLDQAGDPSSRPTVEWPDKRVQSLRIDRVSGDAFVVRQECLRGVAERVG